MTSIIPKITAILLLAFILARLVALSNLRSDETIPARIQQYAGLEARVICYPTTYAEDMEGYSATAYAIIPAVLVEAGEVCDVTLSLP